MNLYSKLQQRAADNKPIRVGLIGAGKFGSMYLAQAPRMPGVHLVAIADLSPDNARANLARVGWKPEQAQAASAAEALKNGTTWVTETGEPYTCRPMNSFERKIVHDVVREEGMKSRSHGEEPHRYVTVYVKARRSMTSTISMTKAEKSYRVSRETFKRCSFKWRFFVGFHTICNPVRRAFLRILFRAAILFCCFKCAAAAIFRSRHTQGRSAKLTVE